MMQPAFRTAAAEAVGSAQMIEIRTQLSDSVLAYQIFCVNRCFYFTINRTRLTLQMQMVQR
jgi:hypothetical protein